MRITAPEHLEIGELYAPQLALDSRNLYYMRFVDNIGQSSRCCDCHHRTKDQALACREARAVLESRKKQHLLKRLGDDLYYRRYRDAIKVTEEYMI